MIASRSLGAIEDQHAETILDQAVNVAQSIESTAHREGILNEINEFRRAKIFASDLDHLPKPYHPPIDRREFMSRWTQKRLRGELQGKGGTGQGKEEWDRAIAEQDRAESAYKLFDLFANEAQNGNISVALERLPIVRQAIIDRGKKEEQSDLLYT
jgi:hypothetical protein